MSEIIIKTQAELDAAIAEAAKRPGNPPLIHPLWQRSEGDGMNAPELVLYEAFWSLDTKLRVLADADALDARAVDSTFDALHMDINLWRQKYVEALKAHAPESTWPVQPCL